MNKLDIYSTLLNKYIELKNEYKIQKYQYKIQKYNDTHVMLNNDFNFIEAKFGGGKGKGKGKLTKKINSLTYEESIEEYKKMLNKSSQLEKNYDLFWKK